jgi:TonB family protein
MRLSAVTSFFFFLVFVTVTAGQTKLADSDPVLQGSASYSMPQSAIDAEIGGSVMVAIRVDETGKPTNAVLVSGPMWPCGTRPVKALEELSSTLSDTMRKLRFAPAIKDGKPTTKDIGLRVELKNPRLAPKPAEIDPATGKPKPRHISGGVLNGKAKHLEKPAYPAEARANRDSGAVTIQVLINEEGKVIRAGAVSGAPTLQFAAREAACSSKFQPTTLSGNLVKVSGVLTYNFVP